MSTSTGWQLAAADAASHRYTSRLPRGAVALRRRAAAGEPLRRLGGGAARRVRGAGRRARGGARRARTRAAGRPRSLPCDASSFIGRDRELGELKALLREHALADSRWDRAVRARRGSRSSWPATAEASYPDGAALVELGGAQPTPRVVPDAVAAALDVRALPGQSLARRGRRVPRRRVRCCSCSTTASTCSRRRPRSPTRSARRAPSSRSSRRAASRCACRRGRLPGSVARHP